MSTTHGKYFEKAKLLLIYSQYFTLTVRRVYSLGAVSSVLFNHGFKLKKDKNKTRARWVKSGNIYYAKLVGISKNRHRHR